MLQTELLSISAFSKMSEVSRKSLIYYDTIGLFKPMLVARNGYRFYHRNQLETIGVIHIFKELGMSLEEIQQHLNNRTPASTLELLDKQEELVQSQIEKLQRAKQMIIRRAENIRHSLHLDTTRMYVVWQEKTPLLLSSRVHSSKKQFSEELWEDFQKRLQRENAPIGYPNGVIIDKEDMIRGEGDWIAYMFSQMETVHHKQEYMPEGYYLVAYARADYGDTEKIFPPIFEHIHKQHYTIIGHAYEEYLQDEVVLQNSAEYLVRVMVHIEKPSGA